jgi:hypothetical protein
MKTLALALLTAAPVLSQSYFPRHNLTLGLGAQQPRADLRNLFDTSFSLGVNYGYRFHRYFQADAGLDTGFGAAGVRDFVETALGPLRIRDYQYLVPFGGRAILPLMDDRLQIFGGAGGAYMRYSERIRQPSDYFRIDCPYCTSRDGWGSYGQLGAAVFVDSARHFRVGFTTRVYRGHTDGEPLGEVSRIRTRDNWIHMFGEVGFSF